LGLIVGGVGIGQTDTTTVAIQRDLREFDDCTLPCWFGITPGVTTIPRANRMLMNANYTTEEIFTVGSQTYIPNDFRRCKVEIATHDAVVVRIRLYDCPPTRLGDLIRLVGQPNGVITDRYGLVFRGGTVIAYAQRIICEWRYTPEMFIGAIDLRPSGSPIGSVYAWRGFTDLRRYMPRATSRVQC
jgi:hypothetical protein